MSDPASTAHDARWAGNLSDAMASIALPVPPLRSSGQQEYRHSATIRWRTGFNGFEFRRLRPIYMNTFMFFPWKSERSAVFSQGWRGLLMALFTAIATMAVGREGEAVTDPSFGRPLGAAVGDLQFARSDGTGGRWRHSSAFARHAHGRETRRSPLWHGSLRQRWILFWRRVRDQPGWD